MEYILFIILLFYYFELVFSLVFSETYAERRSEFRMSYNPSPFIFAELKEAIVFADSAEPAPEFVPLANKYTDFIAS